MFKGMLLTSKVAENFLGVDCLMTGDVCVCVICIFHDKSGDEMHFWVLNGGHSRISAAHTDLALYITWDGPEQLIKLECVWCVTNTHTHTHQTSKSFIPCAGSMRCSWCMWVLRSLSWLLVMSHYTIVTKWCVCDNMVAEHGTGKSPQPQTPHALESLVVIVLSREVKCVFHSRYGWWRRAVTFRNWPRLFLCVIVPSSPV